jgi:hypothetical protein
MIRLFCKAAEVLTRPRMDSLAREKVWAYDARRLDQYESLTSPDDREH